LIYKLIYGKNGSLDLIIDKWDDPIAMDECSIKIINDNVWVE